MPLCVAHEEKLALRLFGFYEHLYPYGTDKAHTPWISDRLTQARTLSRVYKKAGGDARLRSSPPAKEVAYGEHTTRCSSVSSSRLFAWLAAPLVLARASFGRQLHLSARYASPEPFAPPSRVIECRSALGQLLPLSCWTPRLSEKNRCLVNSRGLDSTTAHEARITLRSVLIQRC